MRNDIRNVDDTHFLGFMKNASAGRGMEVMRGKDGGKVRSQGGMAGDRAEGRAGGGTEVGRKKGGRDGDLIRRSRFSP